MNGRDVAQVVSLLASKEADFITGNVAHTNFGISPDLSRDIVGQTVCSFSPLVVRFLTFCRSPSAAEW